MPIDEPVPRSASTRRHMINPGTLWQGVRVRVTGWFRPTHPRFALHLFLITLTVGLLLGMASLAMTGIVQLSRRSPVAAGSLAVGPSSPLPTPMAGGKTALAAAGAMRSSSLMIDDGDQSAPVAGTDSSTEVDAVTPESQDAALPPWQRPLLHSDRTAAPSQDTSVDPVQILPAPGEPVRIGPQAEVVLSVQIDEQGNPIQIGVQRSSGSPALDDAALFEVRNRHFQPTLRDGEPVPATLSVPVRVPTQDR